MVSLITGTIVYILQAYSFNPKIKNVSAAAAATTGGAKSASAHVPNYDTSDIFVGDANF
jgi:hypothetical protein